MRYSPPAKPHWLSREARLGYLNDRRRRFADKYKSLGSRRWTWKGIITRIFGQGIQGVFQGLPVSSTAAISGSMGVAIYDMIQDKRDLHWIPNDVDVFVAIPQSQRAYPLMKLFPIMTKWLRSVQARGFNYKLKEGRAIYGQKMIIFDFECTNAYGFRHMLLPKISFIAHPEDTVRAICDRFDLSICGPILCRQDENDPIDIDVTNEIRHLFSERIFYSKVRPNSHLQGAVRTRNRIKKYRQRGFRFFETNWNRAPWLTSGSFDKYIPFYQPAHRACKQYVALTLGRWPTEQECIDFNVEF